MFRKSSKISNSQKEWACIRSLTMLTIIIWLHSEITDLNELVVFCRFMKMYEISEPNMSLKVLSRSILKHFKIFFSTLEIWVNLLTFCCICTSLTNKLFLSKTSKARLGPILYIVLCCCHCRNVYFYRDKYITQTNVTYHSLYSLLCLLYNIYRGIKHKQWYNKNTIKMCIVKIYWSPEQRTK